MLDRQCDLRHGAFGIGERKPVVLWEHRSAIGPLLHPTQPAALPDQIGGGPSIEYRNDSLLTIELQDIERRWTPRGLGSLRGWRSHGLAFPFVILVAVAHDRAVAVFEHPHLARGLA